jgi:purine-nucleoside phosphorylase
MNSSARFAALAAACREAPPQAVLVLGSGMGDAARRVRPICSVPFAAVPGLPAASVAGHAGRLTLGDWGARRVLLFEGRLHRYEGHSWETVARPVRVAAELGAAVAVFTNAAGGIADGLLPGALMAVRDHIEWTHPYAWRRPGLGGLGGPRPTPYSARLFGLFARAANDEGISLAQGTYGALTGPCYETPAEIRALRAWGADAVGMSTAHEAQTAADAGLECAAVSLITNRAAGLTTGPPSHAEVLAVAAAAAGRLADLLERFLQLLGTREEGGR